MIGKAQVFPVIANKKSLIQEQESCDSAQRERKREATINSKSRRNHDVIIPTCNFSRTMWQSISMCFVCS